jgi:hypothetical protein
MSRRPRKRGYPRHERTVREVPMEDGSVLHILDENNPRHNELRLLRERQAAEPARYIDLVRSLSRLELLTARGRHQERRRLRREEQRTTNT